MSEQVLITKSKLNSLAKKIINKANSTGKKTIDELETLVDGIETGIDTSDATATSEDILLGKTAYVNDIKVVGAIEDYNGEQEGGIDNTQEDGLVTRTITEYSNSRVTEIGTYAFYQCLSLTSVDIPQVTSIGVKAFYQCSSLTSIDLPQVTTISNEGFSGCSVLTSIDLPQVKSIGGGTFNACYSLKALIIRQTNSVCTLKNTSAFNYCYHILGTTSTIYNPNGDKDGYIYVPDSLVDSYKSATNWSTYASQIKPLSELPQEYNTN